MRGGDLRIYLHCAWTSIAGRTAGEVSRVIDNEARHDLLGCVTQHAFLDRLD